MPTIIDRETATPQTDMWEWGGKKTFRAYTFLTSVCLINFICFTQNLCLFFSILFNNIIMILCTELEIHQCAFPTFSPLLSIYSVSFLLLTIKMTPTSLLLSFISHWIIVITLDLTSLTLVLSTTIHIPPPQSMHLNISLSSLETSMHTLFFFI